MTRMNKKSLTNIMGAASIIGLLYCFVAFLYMKPLLTPAMPEPTETIITLGNWAGAVYFLLGIYHIILLVNALKTITANEKRLFLHSVYIVVLILSGITLLTDFSLLTDIGKEYVIWDVQNEWMMLFGFMAFHFLVILYGTFSRNQTLGLEQKLFEEIRKGNDIMFVALNQVGFVCAVAGIGSVLVSRVSGVPESFQTSFMLMLSVLALVPLVSFFFYWAIRNRRKALSTWFDEKQMADSEAGAMTAFLIALPIMVLLIAGSLVWTILPASFWLSLAFFSTLGIFSGVVIFRNRLVGIAEENS
jgi:hypothetical protein